MKLFLILVTLFFMTQSLSASSSLDFIPAYDPRLNEKAQPISLDELASPEIQELIQSMLELSGYEADRTQTKKKSVLVGLAAPQIGVMKQIIIIDAASTRAAKYQSQFDVLINPKIIWESQEREAIPQGCFSVPNHYLGVVERAKAVVVQALKPDGTSFQKRYEGFTSHVVQHEIDHLNGIRFPERISCHEHLHILPNGDKDMPSYRKEWAKWAHHPSNEVYEKLKEGNYQGLVTP